MKQKTWNRVCIRCEKIFIANGKYAKICKKCTRIPYHKKNMKIDITNIKTKELEEVSKKYPNGHITKIRDGKIFWVYGLK